MPHWLNDRKVKSIYQKKKKSKRFYTHVVNFLLCIHEELSLYPQYACKASGATSNCNFTGLGDR